MNATRTLNAIPKFVQATDYSIQVVDWDAQGEKLPIK
jgi:hypothetical protein